MVQKSAIALLFALMFYPANSGAQTRFVPDVSPYSLINDGYELVSTSLHESMVSDSSYVLLFFVKQGRGPDSIIACRHMIARNDISCFEYE